MSEGSAGDSRPSCGPPRYRRLVLILGLLLIAVAMVWTDDLFDGSPKGRLVMSFFPVLFAASAFAMSLPVFHVQFLVVPALLGAVWWGMVRPAPYMGLVTGVAALMFLPLSTPKSACMHGSAAAACAGMALAIELVRGRFAAGRSPLDFGGDSEPGA